MDEKKMKTYESPSTKKTQVELEDCVCASVEYTGDPDKGVNISSQEVIESSGNDFSGKEWGEI